MIFGRRPYFSDITRYDEEKQAAQYRTPGISVDRAVVEFTAFMDGDGTWR